MEDENKILIRVPTKLKKEFQIICLQQDTNMSDVLREYIETYVKNNKS